MGHEAAGAVDAVGAGVSDLAPGTRVVLDSTVFCGRCEHCLAGAENLCTQREVLGVSCGTYRRHGCFAEFVTVPRRIVYSIPDSLDFVSAALLEPLTIALHAVRQGGAGPGTRSAVVVGAGTIGLAVVAALAAKGVARIAAIDLDPGRLAAARSLGATETFAATDDVGHRAARWAASSPDTDGADLVVEAVGATAAVGTAVAAATRGGTVVLVGNVSPAIELPLQAVVTRQLRLQGSCASAGRYPEAIRLVAEGRVDLAGFVSRVAPLAEGPGCSAGSRPAKRASSRSCSSRRRLWRPPSQAKIALDHGPGGGAEKTSPGGEAGDHHSARDEARADQEPAHPGAGPRAVVDDRADEGRLLDPVDDQRRLLPQGRRRTIRPRGARMVRHAGDQART